MNWGSVPVSHLTAPLAASDACSIPTRSPAPHAIPREGSLSPIGTPVLDPHSSLNYTEPSSDSRGPGAASCGQLWAGPASGDSPPGGHSSSESRGRPRPPLPLSSHACATWLPPPHCCHLIPQAPKETVRGRGPPTTHHPPPTTLPPRARLWESSVLCPWGSGQVSLGASAPPPVLHL